MKINWKRILIAAIWADLVAFIIYAIAYKFTESPVIFILDFVGVLFLGGLWVTRKIESHFVLHGFLVGVGTNIIYLLLRPFDPGVASEANLTAQQLVVIFSAIILLKILGCMLGAFVGGKWRRAQLAAQNIKASA
jgi:hypothetical protein